MGRFFFAVNLPPDAQEELSSLREELASMASAFSGALRWVAPENAHCTLRFLGELTTADHERALAAGRQVSQVGAPFAATAAGLGVFDDEARAHTLWLGFRQGRAELEAIAVSLGDALAERGLPREPCAFVAHLTEGAVCLAVAPRDVRALLERAAPRALRFDVGRFALLESVHEAGALRYREAHRFPLTGAPLVDAR